jgi:hypothetical protein
MALREYNSQYLKVGRCMMTSWHNRRGESQVIVVVGMVLMLILGVVVDRVFLLQALPTARVQEYLHLKVMRTPTSTPASSSTQAQLPTSTPSSSSTRSVPRYLGSSGATISSSLEMTSGPTCFGSYIKGVIRNKSAKKLGYVSVSFAVYDSGGNKVDSAETFLSDLGPGETWRYEALVLDNDAVSYRLTAIEGF